ncbi:MAG: translation initiation factor IF-2 [Spirochaetota bacterium]|nr:MAG: translation initiation factor IF-2 [Spirochaetota bacterium]
MRIHEFAKSNSIPTNELLKILQSLGIKNKKSASVLNKKELEKVQKYIEENKKDKPEVALIKKKPKEREEEHKKIVIKKKKVVILKKPHKEELKKETADVKKKGRTKKEVETVKAAATKPVSAKAEWKAVPKEEKKPVYKLKDKKQFKTADKEKEAGRKPLKERRRYGFRRDREEEEGNIDKLLAHRRKEQKVMVNPIPKEIDILETITVGELARKMNLKANALITKLISLGVMARINDQIDAETATLVAEEYGCQTKVISLYEETVIEEEEDKPEDLMHRPPVVTIMGHVDHGKTKLLDVIRDTNVVETETGGITQHIGAYNVTLGEKKICFLDTPGHEAFTMMRARGAKVTDIVVLVVAADDGVMPQTIEAIDHAKEAGVPVVVAINKIDLKGANPEKVRKELSEKGIVPEEWGGDTLMVEVSALKKAGIDKLLEAILLQAEMLDLKANPKRKASGTIIESKIDTGRGTVATVLVQNGTLSLQDPFVAGIYAGRVRAMFDENGNEVNQILPAEPVEVIGLSGMPIAGDPFQVTENEKIAKQIGQKRQELKRFEESRNVKKITLENLYEQIKEGEVVELKVIIKADVQGSAEALVDSLSKLSTSQVRLNCIHAGVGAINKPDISLASASNAIIIGFRVRPNARAQELAKEEKVDIRKYSIIYDVIDDVKSAMEGLLAPELREEIVANAEVRAVFKVPKIGNVAGSYVKSGKITRGDRVRIIRDGIEIYTGTITSLRRFKEDAREVTEGFECGIKVENFDDLKEEDTIEAFVIHEIAQKLETNV